MNKTIKMADLYCKILGKTIGEIELEYLKGNQLIRLTPFDELYDELRYESETISKDDLAFWVYSFDIEIQPYGMITDMDILKLIEDIEYYIDNELTDSEREDGMIFRDSLSK